MSAAPPGRFFTFTLGAASPRPGLADWRRPASLPDFDSVIKDEPGTRVGRVALAAGEVGILKIYRDRGALTRWRGGPLRFRVQREYDALRILAEAKIPCSVPCLWGWGSCAEHGHFEVLLTCEIPAASSLKQHLGAGGQRLRPRQWFPLSDALRRMHESGVYHGALWPKNILVRREGADEYGFYLIDLARSLLFPRSILGTTMARFDLLSLLYSLERADPQFEPGPLLERYGCSPAGTEAIVAQSRRYRSSRHLRNRLALAFQFRALLARVF